MVGQEGRLWRSGRGYVRFQYNELISKVVIELLGQLKTVPRYDPVYFGLHLGTCDGAEKLDFIFLPTPFI